MYNGMQKAKFYSAGYDHYGNGTRKLTLTERDGYTDGTYNYYTINGRWYALDKETGVSVEDGSDLETIRKVVNTVAFKETVAKAKASFDRQTQKEIERLMRAKKAKAAAGGAHAEHAAPVKKGTKAKAPAAKKKPVKVQESEKRSKVQKGKAKKKLRPNPFSNVDEAYLTKNKIAVTKTKKERAKRGYKLTKQTKYYEQSASNLKQLKAAQGSTVRVGRSGNKFRTL